MNNFSLIDLVNHATSLHNSCNSQYRLTGASTFVIAPQNRLAA